ncbi:MAG TPA: phenylacetate--CoA ligase family protein [Polyangiaceae bacterium]|nr:phenylacetate--CoA ligase family protein [Polyangiaceae bacterium]
MNDLYGELFRGVIYPAWETTIRRRPTLKHWQRLERSQWSSLDELQAFQLRELRSLLQHAFTHTPHYRRRFLERGLSPEHINHLDDLRRLPLLTREEATSCFEDRKSRAGLPLIDKATSGTTGQPLVFAYDRGSEYWRQAIKLRGYGWAGYQPGDRSVHFWGSPVLEPPPPARRAKASLDHWLKREHYVDCTDRSEQRLAQVVNELRRLRPRVLVCYAQAGAALARYVNQEGCRDWPDIAVISAAERLFPSDREALVRAFGPGVFETYGNREVMLMAAECDAHQGMHLSVENLIVEIVVRGDRERPAEPGELGEVVVTDLHNYGVPFIRYLTGDLAIAAAPGSCACGRMLGRLERVEGRTTETLRDGDGNAVSGLFFNVLFAALAHRVRSFQVVQRRDRAIDLKLVPMGTLDEALLDQLRRHCRQHIPGVELRTHVVPELTADRSGKLRVVTVES